MQEEVTCNQFTH